MARNWNYQQYGQHEAIPPRRVIVDEWNHVVVTRDGQNARVLPPGRHRLSRRRDRLAQMPANPTLVVVPGQEILSSDGVTIRATVGMVTTIIDPLLALRSGQWHQRLYLDIQLALRTAIAGLQLEDLMAERGNLDAPLLAAAVESAEPMGVDVSKVAIRDLVVPGEQRRLLAQIVDAKLAGQAQLERARAETAALRNLANAASMLRDNPDLFKLRLVQEMANSTGNTYVVDTDRPASGGSS